MTSATLNIGERLRTAATVTAIACLALGALGTARADPASVAVKYTASELASEQGTLAVYQRISVAAHLVCDEEGTREIRRLAAASTCRNAAIAKAVQTVNSAKLAAVFAAHQQRG